MMQTLLSETRDNRGLIRRSAGMVFGNLRYLVWFWLLNLTLAAFGTLAFWRHASGVMDHSLLSGKLVHGFDASVLAELFSRPEMGPFASSSLPSVYFAVVFFLATALFLPGVFQGYATNYRLPRDEFFRACGRNLWRYIRLLIIAGIIMGIVAGILFGIQSKLVELAGESTNELLSPEVNYATLAVIFLIMTVLRIWFDLAEADVVLSDQNAVRRAIAAGFRHTFRAFWRLLASYVLITILALIILGCGLLAWLRMVPAESVGRAFLVGQVTLLLLLIPRFWQRGVAVAYWQKAMVAPVIVAPEVPPAPVEAAPVSDSPLTSTMAPAPAEEPESPSEPPPQVPPTS